VLIYYRSGFMLNPTAAHEVQTEGRIMRWWESGSVSERYEEAER
jgi:hypothetical protein